MKRRTVVHAALPLAASLAWPGAARAQRAGEGRKVLRYAFEAAETSLDPARINDLYSRILTAHIFEAPLEYDPLARPIKLRPRTAQAMPEHSADFRTWTVRIKPGIFFADDEAFRGRKRELVAEDYAYTLKRFADPANKSPLWTGLADEKITGLAAARQRALDARQPFDYDRPIEGVRALDRYTLQIRLDEPRPRFLENFAGSSVMGAVAREVVEHYGESVDAHPVGTGPFRLAQWRRSSLIAMERNPQYRDVRYHAEPAADDAEGQALLARLKGRRLPMIDRVEVTVVEEQQPRWLSFLNGEADFMETLGSEFFKSAMPGGQLSPQLRKQGVRAYQQVETGTTFTFFNMDDPMVGGYTPAQVALRRAIGLGMNQLREVRILRNGQAVLAQSPIIPFTTGYDPRFKSEFSEFDPARAKALLDTYGFVDRDGDGWRERPDGSPLVLRYATQPQQRDRQLEEFFKKDMDALGLRMVSEYAQWPENLKSARAGKLAIWALGSSAAGSDGQSALARYDSRQIGGQNMARFKLPEMDALLDRMSALEDGPERDALFERAKKLAVAYMPYKMRLNRITTDLAYPQLVGYRRPVFWRDWWQYVDIDDSLRSKT